MKPLHLLRVVPAVLALAAIPACATLNGIFGSPSPTYFNTPLEADPATLGEIRIAGALKLIQINGEQGPYFSEEPIWQHKPGFLKRRDTNKFFVKPGRHTLMVRYLTQEIRQTGSYRTTRTTRGGAQVITVNARPGQSVYICFVRTERDGNTYTKVDARTGYTYPDDFKDTVGLYIEGVSVLAGVPNECAGGDPVKGRVVARSR